LEPLRWLLWSVWFLFHSYNAYPKLVKIPTKYSRFGRLLKWPTLSIVGKRIQRSRPAAHSFGVATWQEGRRFVRFLHNKMTNVFFKIILTIGYLFYICVSYEVDPIFRPLAG
jgi:hypothetical protein